MSHKNLKKLLHVVFIAFSCFLLMFSFCLIVLNTPVEAVEDPGGNFKDVFDNDGDPPPPPDVMNSESQSGDIVFENPLGPTNTLGELVNHILAFALKLAIPIATIMIVWSGFLFATSAGNEEKIKTAQKTLIWAIVGLGVAIIATTIPALVREFLGESQQTETGWECDIDKNECYGGVSNATYSTWQACEEDCIQGYGEISESNLSQNSESSTPPPPDTKTPGGFIYQESCREDKSFVYRKCCKANPTISDTSFECGGASNMP